MYTYRLNLRIFIGILIYILIFILTAIFSRIPGQHLDRWTISGREVTFPLKGKVEKPAWFTYTTKIYSSEEKDRYILLSRIDSKGIILKVNNEEVFSIGVWLNSNIWTYSFAAPIHLKKGENTIEMKLKYLFDFNSIYPPSILDKPWPLLMFLNLLFSGLSTYASFSLFSFFVYFTVLSVKVERIRYKYFIAALSLLSTAIFLSNMGFWYSVGPGNLIFLYKRLVYASIYLAFAFHQELILLLFNKQVKYHSIKILSIITAILIIVIPDFRMARTLALRYAAPLFIVNISLITYRAVKYNLRRLVPPSIVLFISLIHFYITSIFSYAAVPIVAYGLSYYAFSIVNFLRTEHETLYTESEIDPLTKAYNRRILEDLEVSDEDVLVYLDVDNFKEINDSFGHSFGDKVLKDLVNVIKDNIKGKDVVIRIGGDEFVIIIRKCSTYYAHDIVKTIEDEFKKRKGLTFSYGITALDKGLDKALEEADEYMYKLKNKKKKRHGLFINKTVRG